MREKKLHAIMIGFCYQGHITSFTNLAIKLASNGCTVTFVHTEYIHHLLSKADGLNMLDADPFLEVRKSGLDIRYATISDGLPPEFDRVLNFDEHWDSVYRHFPSRVDELVENIIRSDEAFGHFLVADTFYSWPASIAKKYNILNVSFWTQPALVFAIYYHLDLLKERGYFPIKGDEEKENMIDFIPGVKPIKTKDLMSYFHDLDPTSRAVKILVDSFEQVKYADFILLNTVHEFEDESVSPLNLKHPTYAVGPLNFTSHDFTKSIVPKSLWAEIDCTKWLDTKPRGSVLYVSFGSLAQSNPKLAEEIANGLLLSEAPFIWVARNGADLLPEGFKSAMKDRGMIVSWCNQNAVLSNPAVGGFLTHCGWNSIMESVWCGVPMICYPFFGDQQTNRKLVIDDWKVGINLCEGTTSSVDRKEVAEKIKILMSGESSNVLRDEMEKMRRVMHKAMGEDGSAHINFQHFLKDLWAKAEAANLIGSSCFV